MNWKLYYSDGSTFSSEDGDWADAPYRGVLAVVVPDEYAGRVVDTGDFYAWPRWCSMPESMDQWGLMDYLIDLKKMGEHNTIDIAQVSFANLALYGVKIGRSLNNSDWREAQRRIVEDADAMFPPKQGRTSRERPIE
jgi:hypothetical protein